MPNTFIDSFSKVDTTTTTTTILLKVNIRIYHIAHKMDTHSDFFSLHEAVFGNKIFASLSSVHTYKLDVLIGYTMTMFDKC